MGDYSYTEIGMLVGTALGGLLGVIGYSSTGEILYLALSALFIAGGITLGSYLDRRSASVKKSCINDDEQDGSV